MLQVNLIMLKLKVNIHQMIPLWDERESPRVKDKIWNTYINTKPIEITLRIRKIQTSCQKNRQETWSSTFQ